MFLPGALTSKSVGFIIFEVPRREGIHYPMKATTKDILRILIAIILPPLGVFLQVGIGAQFWINILLTLFGYIPGIIHAVYIIVTRGPR